MCKPRFSLPQRGKSPSALKGEQMFKLRAPLLLFIISSESRHISSNILTTFRNQNLANVFYRLHLIEAYGTGLRKIMDAYEGSSETPVISVTKNSFKITLPNINAEHAADTASKSSSAKELDDKELQLLAYVREHGAITRPEAEKLLGVSASTASRLVNDMIKNNLLSAQGKARNIRYVSAK